MPDTTTIYITKGAETHGIRKVEAVRIGGGFWKDIATNACFASSQAHASLSEAVSAAEARRTKQIASLKKQIAAMEAIDLTKVREG